MANTTSRMARGRRMGLALAAFFLVCATSARATEIMIKIDNFVFSPDTVTIKPGDVVTWQNADDIPHTVVSTKQGAFRSKPLDTDDKYTFAFAGEGTFEYFCGLHPHMKGKIVVAP